MGFLLSLAEVHPIWKPGLSYLQSVELWEQEIVSSNKSVEPMFSGVTSDSSAWFLQLCVFLLSRGNAFRGLRVSECTVLEGWHLILMESCFWTGTSAKPLLHWKQMLGLRWILGLNARSGTLRKVNKRACSWVWNSQADQIRELWEKQNLSLDASAGPRSPVLHPCRNVCKALSLANSQNLQGVTPSQSRASNCNRLNCG